jgi:hypothetical protein
MTILLESNCAKSENPPEYKYMFPDPKFKMGFRIGSVIEGHPEDVGLLTYGSVNNVPSPFWKIGQWNNINSDLSKATFSRQESNFVFERGGSKIAIDTTKGRIFLELNSSTEYGKNGITHNPRRQGEAWPHLLVSYNFNEEQSVKISDAQEIFMIMNYQLIKCDNKMPEGLVNGSLHAAQFFFYITAKNNNKSSSDFGKYLWFGLVYFDTRHEFSPLYGAIDGGSKPVTTGMFVYQPSMRELMTNSGKTEIGKQINTEVSVLPHLKEAFRLAQERNFLTKTRWEDLYIMNTNYGWELPGTYDVAVEISNANVKYKLK